MTLRGYLSLHQFIPHLLNQDERIYLMGAGRKMRYF